MGCFITQNAHRVLSIGDTLGTHFDIICDLSLKSRTATWNLFVLFDNENESRPLPTLANTEKAI